MVANATIVNCWAAVSEKSLAIASVYVVHTRAVLHGKPDEPLVAGAWFGDRKSACRSLENFPMCIVCEAKK